MTNLFFLIAALPFPDSTTAKSEPRFRLANKQVSQVEASVLACLMVHLLLFSFFVNLCELGCLVRLGSLLGLNPA